MVLPGFNRGGRFFSGLTYALLNDLMADISSFNRGGEGFTKHKIGAGERYQLAVSARVADKTQHLT